MKSLLVTAVLALSASVAGWYGNDIYNNVNAEVRHEIGAIVEYFKYDPEIAFEQCFTKAVNGAPETAGDCAEHLKRWIDRDGKETVMPKVQKLVGVMLLDTMRDAFAKGFVQARR